MTDEKSNEELDAELLALFAEAEQEVAEEEREAEQAREAAAPTKNALERGKAKNAFAAAPATAPPSGKGSKVSPALQRFAFNQDTDKKKK